MLPSSRPQLTRDAVSQLLSKHSVGEFALVGIRGYYLNNMGKPGANDRGIYDDAIFLITPNVFAAFNANVDPSVFRKRIATLKPGLWWYKIGVHGLSKPRYRQYRALVQASPVTVTRDGAGEESGFFGINIHRGGKATTSSEGCQTLPTEQWSSFFGLVESEMKRCEKTAIPYLLTDGN